MLTFLVELGGFSFTEKYEKLKKIALILQFRKMPSLFNKSFQ